MECLEIAHRIILEIGPKYYLAIAMAQGIREPDYNRLNIKIGNYTLGDIILLSLKYILWIIVIKYSHQR